jgi:hypothetical protein
MRSMALRPPLVILDRAIRVQMETALPAREER